MKSINFALKPADLSFICSVYYKIILSFTICITALLLVCLWHKLCAQVSQKSTPVLIMLRFFFARNNSTVCQTLSIKLHNHCSFKLSMAKCTQLAYMHRCAVKSGIIMVVLFSWCYNVMFSWYSICWIWWYMYWF